jgi:hypothetical protein
LHALTFELAQAHTLLDVAPASTISACVVVSLLTGAPTGKLRALT